MTLVNLENQLPVLVRSRGLSWNGANHDKLRVTLTGVYVRNDAFAGSCIDGRWPVCCQGKQHMIPGPAAEQLLAIGAVDRRGEAIFRSGDSPLKLEVTRLAGQVDDLLDGLLLTEWVVG